VREEASSKGGGGGSGGSMKATTAEGWEVLPEELLVYIFTFLRCKDLFAASLVNKRWKQLTEDGTM